MCILTLYIAPSGNFCRFLLKLETIILLFYIPTLHIRKADNLPPSCAIVTKCGNLSFLEPFTFYSAHYYLWGHKH